MKRAFLLFLMLPVMLFAYESVFQELMVPVSRHFISGDFRIQYKSYGPINTSDPLGSIIDNGANCFTSANFYLFMGLDAGMSFTSSRMEYAVSGGYSYSPPLFPVAFKLNVEYINFENTALMQREHSVFPSFSAYMNLFNIIKPGLMAGYDTYTKNIGAGAGIILAVPFMYNYSEEFGIFAEYYPYFDDMSSSVYIAGMFTRTWGHQFIFSVSNSNEMGMRRMTMGAILPDEMYFSIAIRREIKF